MVPFYFLNCCVNIYHACGDNRTFISLIPCCFNGGFAATHYIMEYYNITKEVKNKLMIKATKKIVHATCFSRCGL